MAIESGPCSRRNRFTLAPISRRARSQLISRQPPGVRFSGARRRSGECSSSWKPRPLGQAKPRVTRWHRFGEMRWMRLPSISISRPQAASQIRQKVYTRRAMEGLFYRERTGATIGSQAASGMPSTCIVDSRARCWSVEDVGHVSAAVRRYPFRPPLGATGQEQGTGRSQDQAYDGV